MNRFICGFFILFLISDCYNQSQETATSGHLNICVTESHIPLLKKHVDEFNSLYPNSNITLFGAKTREAIVYLFNDSIKFIVVDRPFNKEEKLIASKENLNFRGLKIAEDALAVIVHRSNSLKDILLQTLKDIVTGSISKWKQIPDSELSGEIEFVMTDRNSGIYELIKEYFFKLENEINPKITVESQDKILDYVISNPRAIGFVSIACLKSALGDSSTGEINYKEPVRVLAVVSPDSTGHLEVNRLHQANIYQGRYPLHYPVCVYFNEKSSLLGSGFCSYIASASGQRIILKSGLVPATMPVRLVQLK